MAVTDSEQRNRRRTVRVLAACVAVPAIGLGPALTSASVAEEAESRASARFLDGQVLALDLRTATELGGVTAENIGGAEPILEASPLDLATLDALPVDVGGVQLPLGEVIDLGAVNQWAAADPGGVSSAGSGAVTDGGGIGSGADGEFPGNATVNLTDLLGDQLGDLIASVEVVLGAISSEAHLDASTPDPDPEPTQEPTEEPTFEPKVDEEPDTAAERSYEIAGGTLRLGIPAITDLRENLSGAVGTVESTLDGLAGPEGTIAGTLGSLDSLSQLLDALKALPLVEVTGPEISVTVETDLNAKVDEILATPIGGESGVQLDLANGTLIVDLDSLVEGGLSGQEPNTDLLSPEILAGLGEKVTQLLEGLTDQLVQAITEAVRALEVEIGISAEVNAAIINDVLDLSMSTTVGGLIDGDAELVDNSTGVVVGVVAPLVAELANTITETVGGLVNETLFGEGGPIAMLGETVAPAVEALGSALEPLGDVLGNLLAAKVNVQADEEGVHSVAAIKLDVLPAQGDISIVLAKSAVGTNVAGSGGVEPE